MHASLAGVRTALRLLYREARAGELTTPAVAVALAVASLSAVGLFADRLDRAMLGQAAELQAADLVVGSPDPLPAGMEARARALGLRTARTLTFRTMAAAGDALALVEAKAASPGYPLRGVLQVSAARFGPARPLRTLPAPGTVWIDPRLAPALGIGPGDSLVLGAKTFRITRYLREEPDRAGDLFSIAPRVLLPLADVAATGLVQPGSRVRHQLLVAGAPGAVADFRAAVRDRLGPGQQIEGLAEARPEIRSALERARQFLGLAALSAVLLAGVAVAVSSGRFARRHADTAGLLRCFGLHRRQVSALFAGQLLALGLAAGIAGAALGYGGQAVLVRILADLLPVAGLPPPAPGAAVLALALGLVAVVGFGLPPLLALGGVSPTHVLRREPAGLSRAAALVYATGTLAALALVLGQARDLELAAYVLAGAAAVGAGLWITAVALVKALQGLRGRVGVAWRFGLANVARRGRASAAQAVCFGLGLMALLLLAVVRGDLLDAWRHELPPDTPNYFLVNIQPGEAGAVRAFLAEHGIGRPGGADASPGAGRAVATYPMIRGRLVRINERGVAPDDYAEERARRLVAREFNLSFAARLHPGNAVTAGRWWSDARARRADPRRYSVERGLAETLGIELGDTLTFLVAGREVQGTVTSLRAVRWESFRVNFFVVAPPELLADLPATHIASLYLPEHRHGVLAELVRRHPSVTVVDVDALLSRVRTLMDQAARGVELVFLLTLAAGLTVLVATVQSTLDERRLESAVMRALGASRARVWSGIAAEFLVLGTLAGILAAGGATAIGAILAHEVLGVAYAGSPLVWLIGVPAGAAGIGLAGIAGTRRVLATPPGAILRAA